MNDDRWEMGFDHVNAHSLIVSNYNIHIVIESTIQSPSFIVFSERKVF